MRLNRGSRAGTGPTLASSRAPRSNLLAPLLRQSPMSGTSHAMFTLREREIFSPSALVWLARELLEQHFPLLWIEGEISNFSRPASGHLYRHSA